MSAAWPSPLYGGGTLPDRVHAPASQPTEQAQTVSFVPDVGPPQLFRQSQLDGRGDDFQLTRMTDAQVKELRAFYENTLSGGVLPFQWRPPEADQVGDPIVWFQFVEPPSPVWNKFNDWTIRVRLRRVP